jgi:hypothetical protein
LEDEVEMKRNWIWFILVVLWGGMESYWAGLCMEKIYPLSICFPMVVISALTGLGFLIAFFDSSKKEKLK